jgi:putative iron-dependent peroxidase
MREDRIEASWVEEGDGPQMAGETWDRVPIEAQSIAAPLSSAAIFLTVTIDPGPENAATAREVIADIGGIVRSVGFRDLGGRLSCVVGIGGAAWDRFGQGSRPSQLHAFAPIIGDRHAAVSTPGDLLFHIRAERADLCFEFERLLLAQLAGVVTVVDEVSGFRYFDSRDLLGFVDGTENPVGSSLAEAALIGDEDPDFAGGSYVVIQKYLHDLGSWGELSTEAQEHVIGRTKLDNVERELAPGDRKSHKDLTTIVDDAGVEHAILRDNMPFGRPGAGEFGTYFIGYCRDLWVIERMLHNMFIGDPAGAYDRILDVSRAQTGATFFAPSVETLEGLSSADRDRLA